MPVAPETARFISSIFRSVWSLEILLLLRTDPARSFSIEQLVDGLRASRLVVTRGAEPLVAAGLVAEEAEDLLRYAPASAELGAQVDRTDELYRTSPDAVRRLIISGASGGSTAFADAFRLRGK